MPATATPGTSPATAKPYAKLQALLNEATVLSSAGALLSWDQETMMPAGGAELRSRQLELLSAIVHKKRTSSEVGDLLAQCEGDKALQADPVAAANLREIRRDFDKATKLPTDLVSRLAKASSLGMHAWKSARAKSDFSAFLPSLEKTIELYREKATCYGIPAGGAELYDALLDEYEPGMTVARTRAIFGPFREKLVPLIERVAAAKPSQRPDETTTRAEFPLDKQRAFMDFVAKKIGFDYASGRMDDSTHPFCEGIGPGDTRLTNRYRPDGWADSLSTAMHEGGHGLYEQGLPKAEHFGLPTADAISLGIHESQSRLWENLVGRSLPFWKWCQPEAAKQLGGALASASPETIYKAVNVVRPHFIRVESDELTYNLHIMLRFDLERAMISGDLNPKDLPRVWNERMKKDLGLDVPDDRRGCLQDVHWSMGLIGYFPTYTFGNLYASQFWEAIKSELPNRDELMTKGDFAPILGWLREKVHKHGRRYRAEELCQKITGKPLSHDALLRHLEHKVSSVYG